MARFDLADPGWRLVRPRLPDRPGGVPRMGGRRAPGGVFRVLRTGSPRRGLPGRCGPHGTVGNRFSRRAGAGVRLRVFEEPAGKPTGSLQFVDRSGIRARPHAARGRRGRESRRRSLPRRTAHQDQRDGRSARWSIGAACRRRSCLCRGRPRARRRRARCRRPMPRPGARSPAVATTRMRPRPDRGAWRARSRPEATGPDGATPGRASAPADADPGAAVPRHARAAPEDRGQIRKDGGTPPRRRPRRVSRAMRRVSPTRCPGHSSPLPMRSSMAPRRPASVSLSPARMPSTTVT
ncbi:transposase [Paralimibaculum aggregatum]|uniref:transposase n=1 Tax=Paralimibaculum aggregatum TaxID=3036245 RepID=UPI003317DC15